MNTKTIFNELEQLSKDPQKALQHYHDQQQEFFKNVDQLIKELPVKTQSLLQEQQQKLLELSGDLTTSLQKNPADWQSLGKIWFTFHTEQVTKYLNEANKQNEQYKELLSTFSPPIIQTLKNSIENNSLYQDSKKHFENVFSHAVKTRDEIVAKQYDAAKGVNKTVEKVLKSKAPIVSNVSSISKAPSKNTKTTKINSKATPKTTASTKRTNSKAKKEELVKPTSE